MLNTKVYQTVHSLAKLLMQCVYEKDDNGFAKHYQRLQELCQSHENTEKDHPVQWETLADFTEDFDQALAFYNKALAKAKAINAKDYVASILLAMASLHLELGERELAVNELHEAKVFANKIEDTELKQEIASLLEQHEMPEG